MIGGRRTKRRAGFKAGKRTRRVGRRTRRATRRRGGFRE